MGIDTPDIHELFNWVVPEYLEQYAQQTSSAGQDGEAAEAILYSGREGKHPNKRMKAYLIGDNVCRRKMNSEKFLCYSEQDMTINNQC